MPVSSFWQRGFSVSSLHINPRSEARHHVALLTPRTVPTSFTRAPSYDLYIGSKEMTTPAEGCCRLPCDKKVTWTNSNDRTAAASSQIKRRNTRFLGNCFASCFSPPDVTVTWTFFMPTWQRTAVCAVKHMADSAT